MVAVPEVDFHILWLVIRLRALFSLVFLFACSKQPEFAGASIEASREGWEPQPAWPGFTLVAPLDSKLVYLVDMSGTAVHTWKTGGKPGVATYLTERGTLLKCLRAKDHPIFQDAGGHGGAIQEFDANGEVLWSFTWDSEEGLSHHDIEELPNGNILMVAWDRTSRDVALAAGRDPDLLEGQEFWGGAIYEIEPTRPEGGRVVWSWHALDHVVQSFDRELANYGSPVEHPHRIDINGDRDPDPPTEEEEAELEEQMRAIGYAGGDEEEEQAEEDEEAEEEDPEDAARRARTKGADWMHTNGIDYHPGLDQIVLSVRRYDEIWILDHGTTTAEAKGAKGDLLYRWGNPYAYGMGLWDKRQLFGQHHVEWIPEGYLGQGNLILFNNGARPREYSTIEEWRPPLTSDGTYVREEGRPFGPEQSGWQYQAEDPEDFYSSFISGVQRLPNGNTLICSGVQGRVFEVDLNGETVWDWHSPYGPDPDDEDPDLEEFPTALFRATRYAPDYPGIVALRAKGAQLPSDPGTGPATNNRVVEQEDAGPQGEE